ncbi:MAG TPA: type II secretion system protein [Kineobactrum sp.]
MTNTRGFTLVELILVMVIIGILAAVVGPRFFNRQVFDERLFFEDTLAAVRYGQKLAVASGCHTQVSLDRSGYWLRQADDCSGGASAVYNVEIQGPDGQSPFANTDVPRGVNITPTHFPVVFDSLGRPVGGAANATIGSFTLNVTAETGMVH